MWKLKVFKFMLSIPKNVNQTKCNLVILEEGMDPTNVSSAHDHSKVRKHITTQVYQQKGFNMRKGLHGCWRLKEQNPKTVKSPGRSYHARIEEDKRRDRKHRNLKGRPTKLVLRTLKGIQSAVASTQECGLQVLGVERSILPRLSSWKLYW